MDEHEPMTGDKLTLLLTRDPVVTIMFGVAIMLAFALLVSAAMVTRTHNIEIIKIPMLATGAFAIVGIAVGLFRSLRNAGKKPVI